MERFLSYLHLGGKKSLLLSRWLQLLCAFVLCSVVPVQADERGLDTQTSEKVDAVLLLDTSGSMLMNDPKRLRDEGARLFVQFLKPGDNLAIVDFADEAKIVRPLTPFDPAQVQDVSTLIAGLKTEGQYTDLLAAIEKGREILDSSGRSDAKPVLVLLSDGKMDPKPERGKPEDLTTRMLEEVLPELKSRSRRVYTLAFSADADKELLQQIASGTDAIQWFTASSEEVHQSFADLFLAVKKPQVVPLSEKGFAIDENVSEATFYINRAASSDAVQVQHPNGQVYNAEQHPENIKWFNSQRFEVITIEKPDTGTWRVSGVTKEEGFATILTNLRLITDWGSAIEAGQSEILQARLYESEKPVALPEMTGLVRYAYQITPTDRVAEPIERALLVDDGSEGDKIASDGIFSHQVLIAEPGEYELRIIARAPTFERQLQIPFRVKPPFVTLSVEEGASGEAHSATAGAHSATTHGEEGHAEPGHDKPQQEGGHDTHSGAPDEASPTTLVAKDGVISGNEHSIFSIQLNDEARALKNLVVQLVATDDKRRRITIPVEPAGTRIGHFEVSADKLPADGRYEIRASVSGEGKGRSARRENSRPIVFKRTSIAKPTDVTIVEVEEPKVEEEGFPFVALLLLIVVVGIGGGAAIFLAKKGQSSGASIQASTSPVSEELLASIKALEDRKDVTDVDLNAPEFEETTQNAA